MVNPQFDAAEPFSDGLAEIRIGDFDTGNYGFVDKQGKLVVNPQFNWTGKFSEDLAPVQIGEEDVRVLVDCSDSQCSAL